MLRYSLLVATLCFFTTTFCQNKVPIPALDSLFDKDDYAGAQKYIETALPQLLRTGDPDTIATYVPYFGTSLAETRNGAYAKNEVTKLLKKVQQTFPYHEGLVSMNFAVADFFSSEGDHAGAYRLLGELKQYFAGREASISASLLRMESNRGSYAMRMGNYGLASEHYRNSLVLLGRTKSPDLSEVFIINNSMGIVMWYSSKLDSCLYYFDRAIGILQKMEASPVNQNFRVAMIQNNIANVYDELGKKEDAIVNLEKAIQNYRRYLASAGQDPRKKNALTNQFQSVDNLAKSYQELGDYSRALSLLYFSYEEKKKHFGEESFEAAKSEIQLGAQHFFQRDYTQAQAYLKHGLQLVKKQNTDKTIWEAEAYTYLASILAEQGNTSEASQLYQDAEQAYAAVLSDGYSGEYLQYLVTVSSFHAENGEPAKAIAHAQRALQYARTNQGNESLLAFTHTLNQAKVYLTTKDFTKALQYSNDAQQVLAKLVTKSENLVDSVRLDIERPAVILVNAKASYALLTDISEQSLRALLDQVTVGLEILERKKASMSDAKDATYLMANHKELLDFAKELQLRLYELTKDEAYLNQLIYLQESGIYNRIRSRLDRQQAMNFARVPEGIIKQENALRQKLNDALKSKRGTSDNITAYLEAQQNWNQFQGQLRKDYPDYFNMRYADQKNLNIAALEKVLTPGMTIIRYVFIDKKLYALVLEPGKRKWIHLPAQRLEEYIVELTDFSDQKLLFSGVSLQLYHGLWQPLEKFINSSRVTIIPDGILHYLSFDMLTTRKPSNMRDWVDASLLKRYAISYHYSLMALSPEQKQGSGNGFTAFAPGFSDSEKDSYRAAKKHDTLTLDNEYLSLIPLPFSIDLSKKMQQQFGGDIFIGNKATHQAFKSSAGKHSVIQLGTHAEANNQFPQYSRLIFAKDLNKLEEGNSLYLKDIYECDMSADLTVLTACETGRPGFFDGEGMISMAHAFHYAGSESLLTGLWKIDEQSSTLITEYFYRNLSKGQSKDVALQQAKLRYLDDAEGRMLSPRYWAGLVILGDVSPVQIDTRKSTYLYWLLGMSALLGGVGLYAYFRSKARR